MPALGCLLSVNSASTGAHEATGCMTSCEQQQHKCDAAGSSYTPATSPDSQSASDDEDWRQCLSLLCAAANGPTPSSALTSSNGARDAAKDNARDHNEASDGSKDADGSLLKALSKRRQAQKRFRDKEKV